MKTPEQWLGRQAALWRSQLAAALTGAPAGAVARQEAAAAQLVNNLLDGTMSETAYDTAVVSRLRSPRDLSRPAFPASVDWLRRYQHPDGSWGGRIETAPDRIVSTLAAVVRLAELPDPWARGAMQAGLAYLWRRAGDWRADPPETIAFELLVPQLLDEACRLGLAVPCAALAPVAALREEKLRRLPPDAPYADATTLVHSLEFLGRDLDGQRVRRLRGGNGSYGNSPSATAHVLAHARDAAAEAYLARVMGVSLNGGAPNVYPFEIFERAWTLYNFGLAGIAPPGARPHLDYLYHSLCPEGVGISREGLIPDADDTAMALIVLARAGYPVTVDPLLAFERDDCFSCFPFERNTSISANARVLEALKEVTGERERHAARIAKIVAYLRDRRLDGCRWQDKWHVSPYYATAQVVLAARGVADELIAPARGWLLATQRADGSWGRYRGTSEETAYAMQALATLPGAAGAATAAALARGGAFLLERFDDTDYPELWVGKGLYTPYAVVRSAVLAALRLWRNHRATRGQRRAWGRATASLRGE